MDTSHLLRPGEAARRLGVTPTTLRKWAADGTLRAAQTRGGHQRIPLSEVERLLNRQLLALHDFQVRNAADLVALFTDQGHSAVAYSAPPGAGKTVVLSAVARALKQYTHVVVGAPLRSIVQAFLSLSVAGRTMNSGSLGTCSMQDLWRPFTSAEANGSSRVEAGWDALWAAPQAHVVATHASWDRVQSALVDGVLTWPGDDQMAHALLILDEGHHAGGDVDRDRAGTDGARNVIAAFADAWKARGGAVLYASATIQRGDGWVAVPKNAPWVVRALAAHAREGFAPSHWIFEDVSLLERAVTTQETWPVQTAGVMVRHWARLGRPKTVINFPGWGPGEYAAAAEAAFVAAGARVINAVGNNTAARNRFESALEAERLVTAYDDSTVDVILACKRMREGADWPLAAVVFSVGAVTTLPGALQLFGRAMRPKRGIHGYPERWVDTAALVTFLPGSLSGRGEQGGVVDDVGAAKRNALETAGILVLLSEDVAMGHELAALFRRRGWSRAGRKIALEALTPDVEPELHGRALEAASAAVFDAGFIPPGAAIQADPTTWVRAPYTVRDLLAAINKQAVARELTPEALRVLLGRVVADLIVTAPAIADQIVRHLAGLLDPETLEADDAGEAEAAEEAETAGEGEEAAGEDAEVERGPSTWRRVPPVPPAAHLLVVAFREVLERYGDHVIVEVPDTLFGNSHRLQVIAQFTATDAGGVAEAIRGKYRDSVTKQLPTGSALAAILIRYQKRHGLLPEADGASSFPWTGIAASWRAIDEALRAGDPPLNLQSVHAVQTWFDSHRQSDLSVEDIRAALIDSTRKVVDCAGCRPWGGFDAWYVDKRPRWMRAATQADRLERTAAPEYWPLIDLALRWGFRGLPGGSSLQELLETQR